MRFSPATPRSLKTSGVLGFANSDSPIGSINTSLASCRTSSRSPDLPSLAQSRGLGGFTASGVGCPDDDAQAGAATPASRQSSAFYSSGSAQTVTGGWLAP